MVRLRPSPMGEGSAARNCRRLSMRTPFTRSPLRRRSAGQLLSVALIVATWRGPVPCIHIHSNDADAVTAGLAEHVRSRHADELGESHAHWHVHLMLPQDIRHTDDSPTAPEEPEDPLLAQSTVVQLSGSTAGVSLLLQWHRLAEFSGDGSLSDSSALLSAGDRVSSGPAGPNEKSFLTTMLRAAPLCAVTGVALC